MAQGNRPPKKNLAAEAFRRNYTALHDALAQPDVASGLATKLYGGAIITLETRDAVQMPSFTPMHQTNLLLRAVESSIKIDHTRLRKFTRVLRKQPVLKPIAKQLRQCYRELVSEARLTESLSSGSDTDSTEQHQSQAAKFPMTSAVTHTASPGLQGTREVSTSPSETVSLSPKSTTGSVSGSDHEVLVPQGQNDTSSSFPYLDVRRLSEQEELALHCKLLKQSDKIMHEFNDLTHYTIKSIDSSCVSVKELHTRLSGLGTYSPIYEQVPLLRDQLDKIERAENVEGVFSILHKYYSFFNHVIIEKLIGWFGTPEDKKRLETYVENFKTFCKRRIFECPPDIFGPIDERKTNLVVKVEESWGPAKACPLETVLRLRISLGDILGVNPWTLNLCRIDAGCVELLFQIPSFVEEDIFPLSRVQEKSLTSVRVATLTCGIYKFPQTPEALVPQMSAQAETQKRPTTMGETSESPYGEGGASSRNGTLAVDKRKRSNQYSSSPKTKKPRSAARVPYTTRETGSEDEFDCSMAPMNRDLAKEQGLVMRGETSKSPYWDEGASKGNRFQAIGKRKMKDLSSSGPKAKRARPAQIAMCATRGAGSKDEFEGSSEAGTRRPGFVPPPMNWDLAKQVKAKEQGPTSSSFLYLDTRELSAEENIALCCKLLHDSDKIMDEFSHLTLRTIKSIESSGVSVKELHIHLSTIEAYKPIHKDVPLLRDQLDEIKRAENVMDVFNTLHKYYSFFNYRIIEKLIGWFGTSEDKERLETYIKNFKMFCKRRTFECPPDIFGAIDNGKTNLVVKVEESWGPAKGRPLETVLHLRISLGDILGVEPSTLYLCRIDEGCMELLFQVPSFVEEDIFPLSIEQERSLTSVGVTRFTHGNYSFPQPPEALVPQMSAQAETQQRASEEILFSESTSGTHVQKSSLPRLLDILSPVVHNWSSFAKLIGVPFSQISSIEAANPRPSLYNCFSQSLEWWVANHDDPTYEAILAVLDPKRGETTPLMNRDLAKEVKEFMANKQGSSTVDNYTRQSIMEIQGKFENLLQNVREYLQKKLKKNKIKDLRLFILQLFPDISPDLIPSSSDLNEIFEAMRRNRLWNYMNYFSLEQIVKTFCNENSEMTDEIEKFKKDRAEFQLATKIKAYIPAAKAYHCKHEQLNLVNPDHFSKLSLTLDEYVADHSLKYLEELWQAMSFHMQLPPITLLFDIIESGSIQIVFLIPTKLVPQVIHQAQYSAYFYEMHHIYSVTVGDNCVYDSPVTVVMKQDIPEEETTKGYTCDFAEPPPAGLQTECRVCLQILREPHLVSCCGNRFCQSCINPIKVCGKSCPLCNATTFTLVQDKQLERSLKDLEVHCIHAESGCKWTGELRRLDNHLNVNPESETQSEGCGFITIKCIHCGSPCQRNLLASHQRKECQKLRTHRAMSLSEADLSVVLEDIHPARAKWYNIGLQLGVSANDLDTVRSQYVTPEDALSELLEKWLKTVNPVSTLTWGAVVSALKHTTVGEFQLAEKLQHKHATVVPLQGINAGNLLQNVESAIQIADALGEKKIADDLRAIIRPRLTETKQLEIGFAGLIKAGKTSTLNALIGLEILPVSIQTQTAAEVYVVSDPSKPNGQLVGKYSSKQSDLVCNGVPDIEAYLRKLNEMIRKGQFCPFSKLTLHIQVPFLAQMQDPPSLSISDTAGTDEAGMAKIKQTSALVINRLAAFVVLLNYRVLKSESEQKLIQQLQEHHPQLLDSQKFDRILFLVNQVDAYYEDDNKSSQNPETVSEYVATYLKKNLGVDVPHASIIPFSAKWALNARKWSASLPKMSLLDFMAATVFLKKTQPDKRESIPDATEENKVALCKALEKWSGILAVEEKLKEMFHNCTQILQMSVLDDTTKHIDAILAIIQQRRIKAESTITSQEQMIHAVQKLLDDSIQKFHNLAAIASPQVDTIVAGLKHSISGIIATTVSGHFNDITVSENRQAIATEICAVKTHLPGPVEREMQSTWSSAMQAITNTLTAELTKLFFQVDTSLLSATSEKNSTLHCQINTDIQGLIPKASALQLQLSTNDSDAVSDRSLSSLISQGTITKFRTVNRIIRGERRYGIIGPRRIHCYQQVLPYQIPAFTPNVGAIQGAFRVLNSAWMTKFRAKITVECGRICEGASLKAKQAIRRDLEKRLKEARERLQKGREELKFRKATLAELEEKALRVKRGMLEGKDFTHYNMT